MARVASHGDDLAWRERRRRLTPARTAVGIPRLSRLAIEREEPLRRLSAAAADPICIIHAPAGYGKTTLLAQWAQRQIAAADAPVLLWVTIDSSCNARMPFWRHVSTLIEAAASAAEVEVAAVEPGGDISSSLLHIVEQNLEELGSRVTLVIDAWENIADPSISEDLLRVVRDSTSISLIAATRSIEPGWLRAASPYGLSFLRREDLEFTTQDYSAMALHAGVPLEQREVRSAVAETAGWPFALRILLEQSRDHLHTELTGGETLAALRESLADEIRRMPGAGYLLATSVVDSFSTELAEWLGADPSDRHILDIVESRGLGAWEASTAPTFRLQPVLREGLFARLGPDSARHGFRRLARWHEKNGHLARAFFSALDGEDAAHAVSLAQRAFVPITVALQRIPDALMTQRRSFFSSEPLLGLLNGIAHYRVGNTRRAVQRFMATVAVSEAQLIGRYKEPGPDQVWVQAALTAGLRLIGRYELVEPAYRRFRRMLRRVHDPHGVLESAEVLFAAEGAITLIYLGRFNEARDLLRYETEPPSGKTSRHHYYPAALALYVGAADGLVSRAESHIHELERAGLPRQFDPSFYAVPLHLARALVHLEHHRFDDAALFLNHCMIHWKTIEMWPLLLDVDVRITWQKYGPEAALTLLEERLAEKVKNPPISPQMTALIDELRGKLHVARGDLGAAHALAPARRYRAHPQLAVPRALAFLLGGQPDRALTVAQSVAGSEGLTLAKRVELGLLSASAHLRRGDEEQASRQFAEMTRRALDAGLRTVFAVMPRSDLEALLREHPRADDVRNVLATLPELFPSPDSPAILTERERVILERLDSAVTLAEIASSLSVSINTVKSQARSIYRKLGASGRAAAVSEAHRRGIL
ncbi:ATP/maltotriose-dependent transcriptional regulator MalT [Paramicrobacterium agarici]|nr:ATP/maltotriose-dependent transcriptional regulator MalT [Microbacterium agarici]